VRPLSQTGGGGAVDGIIGIEPPRGLSWTQRLPLWPSLRAAFPATWNLVQSVYGGMWLSISRPLYYREYVGGPIFIGQMARDAARHGLDEFLNFLAMINIAIMAFNLLPVPLLDGGHILLALIEALRRRALTARAYLNFQKVGLVLVGTLFVFIISKDIVRPFQRMRALDRAPRETTTVVPRSR
jgi:regulator of sigma E protease